MSYHKIFLGILGLLALWILFGQDEFVRLRFQELTAQSIFGVLTPLLVIALFLERAVEVFIGVQRDSRSENLKEELASAKAAADKAARSKALAEYKRETKTLAFYAALFGGTLISIAGVRSLWPLLEPSSLIPDSTQFAVFNLVDVFLTAGLLAGGTEGLHKITSLVTDWAKKRRESIDAS